MVACSMSVPRLLLAFALFAIALLTHATDAARSRERIRIHEAPPQAATGGSNRPGQASTGGGFDNHYKNFRSSTTTPTTNSKACPARSVLRVDFTPSPDGDGRMYGNIFGSGVLLASAQDVFEYEIMWKDEQCNCGAEFEVGTQFRHRDNGAMDAMGYSPHSERNANMSRVAHGKWYKRQWSLGSVEGKYIDKFVLSAYSSAGATVTAFFKYIRIVRGDEKRRVVFDSGSEPPNVTPYFPGTIVNSCQHELTLDGSEVAVIGGVREADDLVAVKHGERITLRGIVDSRSLADLGSIRATNDDATTTATNQQQCRYFIPAINEFRWLAANRDPRVRLSLLEVRCRMAVPLQNVVLLDIAKWNETRWTPMKAATTTTTIGNSAAATLVDPDASQVLVPHQNAPWLLDTEFTIPEASQLTHLLHGSWVDVVAEYHLVLDGWVSPMIRTVVKTFRMAIV